LDKFFYDLNQRLLRTAVVEIGKAITSGEDATDLWAQWNQRMSGDSSRFEVVSWTETADERFQDYQNRILSREAGEEPGTGILTGIRHIDKLTYGFMPGNYVLILGRFDTGKTTLMTQFMVSAAQTGNLCLVISPEHSAEEMARKLDAIAMVADPMALRRGTLDRSMIRQLLEGRDKIKETKGDIRIIPGSGRTLAEIATYVNILQPDILYVDGISHLSSPESKGQSDWLRLGTISQGLKALATNTGIPVVTVVQEARDTGKKNVLESIARSDMIGQDADVIIHIDKVTDMQLKLTLVKWRESADRGGAVYLHKGDHGVEFIEDEERVVVGGADFFDF
jgi:replicative DNA helicase